MGRVKSQMEISTGMRSFHFHDFFPKDRIKGDPSQTTWNRKNLGNGTHIFHSEIPFGNFGLPFKKFRFPEKISVRRDKITLSIYNPSEISGFCG